MFSPNVLLEPVYSSPIYTYIFFIIFYTFLGGGIKFIDDAFDERVYSRKLALLFAPVVGIFWAFAMTLSPVSATLLGAIVIGVFLKGKIDNIAFQIGAVSIIAILFWSGLLNFLWIPLIIITLAGVIDEIGNDYFDKKDKASVNRLAFYFFEYRFVMKLAVLYFALIGSFAFYYFLAFLAFDIAYALVGHYSLNVKKHCETKANNVFEF